MGGKKTTEGWRLEGVVNAAKDFDAKVREKGRHRYQLSMTGYNFNCALGTTTSVDQHIIPWLKKSTGQEKARIYQAIRAYD